MLIIYFLLWYAYACAVMNFEQWKFDLLTENNKAKELDDPDYLGTWSRHDDDLQSWRKLSGKLISFQSTKYTR
jgi:hypothetical protein